jgi:5-methylcytosine-specific restriction endonuclease McrA
MSELANKLITLSLNSAWKPIGYKTVQDAIIGLTGSESKPEPSALAIDLEYELDSNGKPIPDSVVSMRPVSWSEWITLPIYDWHLSIQGATRKYRVPTVMIAVNYDKIPHDNFDRTPSNADILKRDNYTCQISGEKLTKEELNVDHVIPKDRGGGEGWENKVACKKDLNQKKGNKLNSEVGYKLIRQPVKPKPVSFGEQITEARHNDWRFFINKKS